VPLIQQAAVASWFGLGFRANRSEPEFGSLMPIEKEKHTSATADGRQAVHLECRARISAIPGPLCRSRPKKRRVGRWRRALLRKH